MDLQLIAIAVVVIIVIIILLACFVFSTRERTFEDALAEQKGLGILLSSGQHGKSGEKHKDKHKSHHDTGGGAQKKKAQQQKSTETVAASGTTQQRPPKKEKEEKEKLQRQRSSASASAEEKEVKKASTKESTPVAAGGSESSRSRHSSSGEGISNIETSEGHGKKAKRQQHQQSPKLDEEHREDVDEKAAEQKAAKKGGKKKRRADDEVDAAAPLRMSFHEEADQQPMPHQNGDLDQHPKQELPNVTATEEKADAEAHGEQQQFSKKPQKKKQKGSGKQQHEEEHLHQDKENAAGDRFDQVITAPATAAPPAKQKAAKSAPMTKAANYDENNLDVIIEQLKTSSLNHTQLEFVLNAVLNKQEQGHQNAPKPDQLASLKRQLDEKEKALSQETQLAAGVNQKLKELRQQYDSDKARFAATERTYQEQLGGRQRDLQAAQQKLQELQAQCNQFSAQSRQAQDQLLTFRKALEQAPNPTQIQQLRDENQRLKEHLARNDQESHARTSELQRLRQDIAQRENQLHQAEQRFVHLQQGLTVQESTQAQQLADYQQKLAAKDVAVAQLEQELANVRREWSLLETSVRELRNQANVSSQAPAVERNVRLQNAQQADDAEVSDKLKAEIHELKTSKDHLTRDLQASKTAVTDLEKRVKELDKELKEAQTSAKRQTDTSQKELRQLKEDLEKAHRERADLQAEKTRITSSSSSNSETIEKLEKAHAELRTQLENEKKARTSAEAEINKLKAERDAAVKAAEEQKKNRAAANTTEETITLKQQVQHLQSSASGKDKEVDEWRRRSSELETKTKSLESDLEKLKEDRRGLELKIQSLQQENSKLSEQAALASHNGHSDGASADALKIQEFSLTHLNKQLITKDGEIAQLKQQLDQQRQKNSELRERNQKVVEAMNQLEKTSKDVNQKLETRYQKQLEDQEKQTKQLVAKLVPDTKIPEKESFFEWIKEIQRVVVEKTKVVQVEKNIRTSDMGSQGHSKELDALKRDNAELHSKLDRYQKAFQRAEVEFKTIEDHAAKQEKSWRERVESLEKELAKIQAGHTVDLTPASSKHTKEVELKLVTLEKLQQETTTYKTEVERLRTDLETERVGARDLSSQVVKLRGMLKTGQDALKQEQDTVAQLQKQLKAFQGNASASSNDAKEGKGEQQLHDELKELRTKLAQREQQLEREMMINKQLNNKLASLGVASPPSASVGSSNGSL